MATFFDLPIRQETVSKTQSDESVRVELTLSKELHDKIQRAQELLSHSLPSGDLVQFLEFVSERIIKQKTSLRNKKEDVKNESRSGWKKEKAKETKKEMKQNYKSMDHNISEHEPGFTATVAVRASTYKNILMEQKCCQFKDATGKQCNSRWHLQVDHIQPRWAGGGNEIENLQILCAQHNRLKYRKESRLVVR